MKRENRERRSTAALFLLYVLGLLALLFLRAPRGAGGWNLIPLRTIGVCWRILRGGGAWSAALRRYAWTNLLGNVLLFVPIGVFLPALFPRQRRFGLFLLTTAASVIIIEGLQYLTTLGALDVDDLILNLTGAALGFALWQCKRSG